MTNDHQLVGEALDAYFEKYGLGKDGGLDKPWGKVKVGNFYIPIPNPDSRKRALVFHDIHHLATGYTAEWQGEAAIAGWEVGSGCNDFYAAWVLDLGLMALGIWIFPKTVFNAFVRGLRSRNLYHYLLRPQEAKQKTIAELRTFLHLTETGYETPTTKEKIEFVKWWIISWVFSFVFFLLPLFSLIGLAWWWLVK
jgi:hypothetical protein